MKKINISLLNAVRALSLLSLAVPAAMQGQQTYTMAYTGAVQTLTLPTGNWGIQCWGANGGSITTLGGQGIGGYSYGEYQVTVPVATLNIFVGGRGNPATGTSSSAGAGGWNGGGGGAAIGRSGGGGGGATDVRVGGVAASNRIIVAGGGGGAAYYGSTLISSSVAPGGNGGGPTGQNGSIISSAGVLTLNVGGNGANGATPGAANFILSNGLACGAGGGASSGGSIGQQGTCGGAGGAQGPGGSGSTGSSAGGGGGYAGGAGGVQSGNQGVSGGGGSGYVGGVNSGTAIQSGQPGFVANPQTNGHGLIVVTELCSVYAYAPASTNSLSPEICPGESIILTTNAVGNYSWSTGQTSNSIIVTPATNTVYSVSGTGSLVCNASGNISVTVNSGPAINVSATNTIICQGQSVVLSVTGGNGYQWFAGPATAQYTVQPATSDIYSVTVTHTLNNCVTDTAIAIGVVIPVVNLPGSMQVCAGISATILAQGADDYLWSGISTGSVGTFVFQPVGTVTMTLVATTMSLTASCPVTHTFVVQVLPLPILGVSSVNDATCTKETNTLIATGAQTYTWTGVGTGNFVAVSPSVSTIYTVVGTDANGCVGSAQIYAMVSKCVGVDEINSDETQMNLYPNPNQGSFAISATTRMDLILVSQVGQQVQRLELNEQNGFTVDVSGLERGIYFVMPAKAGTGLVRKVVVQ